MGDGLDKTTQELIKRGQEAWDSLKRGETWEKWQTVGFALDAGQRDIMRALGINQPQDGGRAYAERMSAWLSEYRFSEIDKGVRSRLIQLIQHLPDVEAWRATLDLKRRIEINHPIRYGVIGQPIRSGNPSSIFRGSIRRTS